eukprot:scaffold58202_cov20-Tisochrysis_lutea.AAC.1
MEKQTGIKAGDGRMSFNSVSAHAAAAHQQLQCEPTTFFTKAHLCAPAVTAWHGRARRSV